MPIVLALIALVGVGFLVARVRGNYPSGLGTMSNPIPMFILQAPLDETRQFRSMFVPLGKWVRFSDAAAAGWSIDVQDPTILQPSTSDPFTFLGANQSSTMMTVSSSSGQSVASVSTTVN
jgi:hypothetical protein